MIVALFSKNKLNPISALNERNLLCLEGIKLKLVSASAKLELNLISNFV